MLIPKSITTLESLAGKKVLVRVDFNVPIENGKITGDTRIKKSLATIEFLRNQKAKIILISHIEGKGGDSLRPIYDYLMKIFPLTFVEDIFSKESLAEMSSMADGDIILVENIRQYPEEKKNDREFSKKLAGFADIYVNDAFSVSHRSHASIVGVPEFLPHYAGLLLSDEINHLKKIFHPPHPFLFILGGAKFDTKLPLIQKFLTLADHVFVGGALANNLFKARRWNVGASLVSGGDFSVTDIVADTRLLVPTDVIVQDKNTQAVSAKKSDQVGDADVIMDAGPETMSMLQTMIGESKCVLWNGPLGNYELGFTEPTIELAKIISDADGSLEAVVGGGDTLAAISSLGEKAESKISFISTGGGAMLQYLLDETLVGIEALK
ncbi:MAG: phosphoglycerate kinase [Candidatus Pacebacteria bacterium]|nr:phosphoglycerate kinase [Candidatus Paceibacterota bacterium]